jgi:type IV pilus assembly protein PilB
MPKRKKIGDILVEKGLITREQLMTALEQQKTSGEKLGRVLVGQGLVSEQQIMLALQQQLGIPYADLDRMRVDPSLEDVVPVNLARRYNLVPVKLEMGSLYVAMDDPMNFIAIEDLRMITQLDIKPMVAPLDSILNAIRQLYRNEMAEKAIEDFKKELGDTQAEEEIGNLQEISNAPIVRLVSSMIEQAVLEQASDIHVEPTEKSVRVRFRVDGRLMHKMTIPKNAHAAIITRIKIIGNMDIAERRLPQDGRLEQQIKGRNVDLRISTLPTVHGEKAVMRILDRSSFLLPKQELGFTKENMVKFEDLLKNPHGIILVTGPTGSGKSTTLYTMLHELNEISENIITVENPVEFMMEGLNQVQVNTRAGLTFASALRSILRQDPDIIMIGEIRDQETVQISIRAAITGHLVLSTIHTNDAVGTVARLMDMGIESYMLSASLVGVISQRLLRKLCPRCAESVKPDLREMKSLGKTYEDIKTIKKPVGCSYCNNTGYKGRIAVHEFLMIDKEFRAMVNRGASVDELRDGAIAQGMKTLGQECARLLRDGVTSLPEVIRAAYSRA